MIEKVFLLENLPQMGRVVPEIGRPDIRELLYRQYRIVYQIVSPANVAVLLIHNSARPLSLESLFG